MARIPPARVRIAALTTALVAAIAVGSCEPAKRAAVRLLDRGYPVAQGPMVPIFDGPDAERARIAVALEVIAEGLPQITDIQPVPGRGHEVIVLQKQGRASRLHLGTGEVQPWLSVEVVTASEQGLLGLAFDPDFTSNGRFFLNLTPAELGGATRIARWRVDPATLADPRFEAVVLDVAQPYANHNAGQLAFGPDGMLYVGLGDGGFRGDSLNAGQDGAQLLGKMLRIDVRGEGPYRVPPDNPFVGDPRVRDEVWALGLRNPWRYAFAPDGALIVADVGQDRWEEIDLVGRGSNLGWRTLEGHECFKPAQGCETAGTTPPIHVYGRDAGHSVTGGYVVTGGAVPALAGRYVFGDFVTGRLWALELPDAPGEPARAVATLGRWPIMPATFGLTADGDLLIGDFGAGRVLRVVAPD